MRSCEACKIELPEEGVFCPSCGNQIGCKSCPATLTPGARFCAQCGASVEKVSEIQTNSHDVNNNDAGFNIIEIERGASRLRAKLSDPAVDSLSRPLTIYMAAAAGVGVKRGKQGNLPDINLDDEQPMLPGLESQNGHEGANDVTIEAAARKQLPPTDAEAVENQRLKELFRERDGHLRLEEPELKATGKFDYAQRLTFLYLYALEKANNDSVPRTALDAVLEKSSVVDWRVPNWIKSEAAIEKEGDNLYLNSAGRRKARQYLEEAFDPDRTETWLPGKSNSSGGGKASGDKSSNKQPTKRSAKSSNGNRGRKSLVTTMFLPKWKALGLNIDSFSLLKGRPPAEQGIFGLWAIRRAAGDAGRIISESVLTTFLYQAFEIKADKRGLGRALLEESKKKDKKVLHIEGTKFQITPDGMAAAEKIAGLTKGKK